MTKLTFTPAMQPFEFSGLDTLSGLDIPVEVRARNLKIVARTTASQPIEVEPGAYFVSAVLPAGQELTGFVEVSGEPSVDVELALDTADAPVSGEHEDFLTRQGARSIQFELGMREPNPDVPPTPSTIMLTWLSGNILSGELAEFLSSPLEAHEGQRISVVTAGQVPAFVRIDQPRSRPLTLATPSLPWQTSTLVVTSQPNKCWSLDLHLANGVANLLLHYRASGQARAAAETLESPWLDAESLLQGKMSDPLAAAVGAYALLRFADLDRLHNWTKNLFSRFPWLPDGAAVWGEHLARLGKHEDAVLAFLALADRGVPMFTDGFSFALDRLRLYRDAHFPGLSSGDAARAETLFRQLVTIAPHVDFGNPSMRIDGDLRELVRLATPTVAQ